jgi:transcriptional regulator with XRE-family HTH domain
MPFTSPTIELLKQFNPPDEPRYNETPMGTYLRKFIASHGRNMRQLADISGVSTTAISTYRTGQKQPRIAVLKRLAEGMAVIEGKEGDRTAIEGNFQRMVSLIGGATSPVVRPMSVSDRLSANPLFQALITRLEGMTDEQVETVVRLALNCADTIAPGHTAE